MSGFRFQPLRRNHPGSSRVSLRVGAEPEPVMDGVSDGRYTLKNMFESLTPDHSLPKPPTTTQYVDTWEELEKVVDKCAANGLCVFDVETTGLSPHGDDLVSIQITSEVGHGYYIPLGHTSFPDGYAGNMDKWRVLNLIHSKLFVPASVRVVAHNLKFDYQFFLKYGFVEITNVWDTMIGAHVLNENHPSYSLKALTRSLLGYNMTTFGSLNVAKDKTKIKPGQYASFADVPLERALPYACADVDMTLRLYEMFLPEVDRSFKTLFYQVEMPLIPTLARMEYEGVELDTEYMELLDARIAEKIEELRALLISTAESILPGGMDTVLQELNVKNYKLKVGPDGTREKKKSFIDEFNWDSSSQLVRLFELMGIKTGYVTGAKRMSTDAKALRSMARKPDHRGNRIAKCLLNMRQTSKIRDSFTSSLSGKVNPITGRIHCNYNQHRVVTGRLSSSDPNLQQIPKRGICSVRYPFKPKAGYVFVQCDYSQVELRILAHIAQDHNMINAFKNGIDIHSLTARECFPEIPDDYPLDKIAKDFKSLRDAAKTINFGIVYGMSSLALSENLGISKEKAAAYIDAYLSSKPKVKEYMIYRKREMEQYGYVKTPLGRRRRIPKDANGRRPFGWDRKAINFPIQSASAEVLKYVMSKVRRRLDKDGWDAKIIMQIHDELIIEAHESIARNLIPIIKEIFEHAVEDLGYHYDVPLSADPAIQLRWAIPAEECTRCGSLGAYVDKYGGMEGEICIHCEGIRYPRLHDIDATFDGFEKAAVE